MNAIRFNVDGEPTPKVKRARKQAPADSPKPKKSKRATMQETKHTWSHSGVGMCVGMSAILNAWSSVQKAPMSAGTIPWVEWNVPGSLVACMFGLMVPVLVLVLAKIAGMQYRTRTCVHTINLGRFGTHTFMLAYVTAFVGVFLLALSLHHCANAIMVMTGSHEWMGWCMAVGIDCGLVACELDIVLA